MKHYIILYIATLLIIMTLDIIWLGGVMRGFYKARMGDLLEFHALPGLLFYLMYAAGILLFVDGNAGGDWKMTLSFGAALGFLAYATYDLTNLATLRGWSVTLSIADVAWGTVATAIGATGGMLATKWLERVFS